MKKLLFVILGLSLTAGAMAQTDPKKKAEMRELRADERDKAAASHKVNRDITHVRVKKAVHDHKAVAQKNKEIRHDSKRLKDKGVSHPVAKAKRQNKVQDDNKKDHTY